MVQLVVTPEQASLLRTATDTVLIVDSEGNRLGSIAPPFTAEEITEAKRRAASNEPRRSSEQVFERLRSLEAAG